MHRSRQSKRGTSTASVPHPIVAAAILTLLSMVPVAIAQHTIPTKVIAGGGSQGLSGNDHTLSGTLGQPATQTLAGQTYQVRGGFWRSAPRAESIFSDGFEGGPE